MPVTMKDVAGLVPGAYEGKGRGDRSVSVVLRRWGIFLSPFVCVCLSVCLSVSLSLSLSLSISVHT